jgi:hypothetical protein
MVWRWAGWSAGFVLLIVPGLVLLLQVSVPCAGTPPRAYGPAWDVVAGRGSRKGAAGVFRSCQGRERMARA